VVGERFSAWLDTEPYIVGYCSGTSTLEVLTISLQQESCSLAVLRVGRDNLSYALTA